MFVTCCTCSSARDCLVLRCLGCLKNTVLAVKELLWFFILRSTYELSFRSQFSETVLKWVPLFASQTTHHTRAETNAIRIDRSFFIIHLLNHLNLNRLPKWLCIFTCLLLLLSYFMFFDFFYVFIEFKIHFLENTFTKLLVQLFKSLLLLLILDNNWYNWLAFSWHSFLFGRGPQFSHRTGTLNEFEFLLCDFVEFKMHIFGINRRFLNVHFNSRCLVF